MSFCLLYGMIQVSYWLDSQRNSDCLQSKLIHIRQCRIGQRTGSEAWTFPHSEGSAHLLTCYQSESFPNRYSIPYLLLYQVFQERQCQLKKKPDSSQLFTKKTCVMCMYIAYCTHTQYQTHIHKYTANTLTHKHTKTSISFNCINQFFNFSTLAPLPPRQ